MLVSLITYLTLALTVLTLALSGPLSLFAQRGRRFFPNNVVVECVVEAYLPMVTPLSLSTDDMSPDLQLRPVISNNFPITSVFERLSVIFPLYRFD